MTAVSIAVGGERRTVPGAPIRVVVVVDPDDPVASSGPVRWAVGQLQEALSAHGVRASVVPAVSDVPPGSQAIVVSDGSAPIARRLLHARGVAMDSGLEAVGLVQGHLDGRDLLLAAGSDVRGAVYAVLELADRVDHGDVTSALTVHHPVIEQPANVVRSIYRPFTSEIEDKAWFYDREGWKRYLTMLATQRINRFSLTLGIGYNTPDHIRDSYFFFAYPFLLKVPGYEVRAAGLPDDERDRNLAMLKFVGEETVARGMHFQVGLWSHGRDWPNSASVNYPVVGLSEDNHAPYCRDAIALLLRSCPAIGGLTFRIHSESGIPQGRYDLWKVFFDGVASAGRRVEIDMHAKELTNEMLDIALGTGMPITVSPKYWAEHMGLPYHQAAIREKEMVREEYTEAPTGLGRGARGFLRYGYGDLLTEDRRYGVVHRVWPGTQHLLLWGDPVLAAGYGRVSGFCGSLGVEMIDPLGFKGRQGSGRSESSRCGYADHSLEPRRDWEKFLLSYRIWGRLMYNPESDPEVWRRYLRREYGAAARDAGDALAAASRIPALITTAHGPAADCNRYWPEMYSDIAIVDPRRNSSQGDMAGPRTFGNVSPFDRQLFYGCDDYADALVAGTETAKYTPLHVAQWLQDLSESARLHLTAAASRVPRPGDASFRRLAADVAIQSGTGMFFAWKMRSAVLWRIHERTGYPNALAEALKAYRLARAAWADMAQGAKAIYVHDVTFGEAPPVRGHWTDRLPAMDADLADMEARQGQARAVGGAQSTLPPEAIGRLVRKVLSAPSQLHVKCRHTPRSSFRRGEPLEIDVSLSSVQTRSATLHFRHVNQAVAWRSAPMSRDGSAYRAVIPGPYTETRFPLQYYFEIDAGPAGRTLSPGLDPTRFDLPYHVVRQSA